MFVSSFGYYFDELSYKEKMSLHKRTTTILLVAIALLLILPSLTMGQPQLGPFAQARPGQPQNQVQNGEVNPRVAEFFCQWTPQAPRLQTQQQCIQAFTPLSLARTVQNFCLSVGTFCTVSHLTLCPRQDTVTACRTCLPFFQRDCRQVQQQPAQWQG
ncbi:hypothetical protein ACOMHN_040812 [Nucella lapillus]